MHTSPLERDLEGCEMESSNNPPQVAKDKDQYKSRRMTSEESERGFGAAMVDEQEHTVYKLAVSIDGLIGRQVGRMPMPLYPLPTMALCI